MERGERGERVVVVVVVGVKGFTLCMDMNCTYVVQEGLDDKSLIMIMASVYCVLW